MTERASDAWRRFLGVAVRKLYCLASFLTTHAGLLEDQRAPLVAGAVVPMRQRGSVLLSVVTRPPLDSVRSGHDHLRSEIRVAALSDLSSSIAMALRPQGRGHDYLMPYKGKPKGSGARRSAGPERGPVAPARPFPSPCEAGEIGRGSRQPRRMWGTTPNRSPLSRRR